MDWEPPEEMPDIQASKNKRQHMNLVAFHFPQSQDPQALVRSNSSLIRQRFPACLP